MAKLIDVTPELCKGYDTADPEEAKALLDALGRSSIAGSSCECVELNNALQYPHNYVQHSSDASIDNNT